MNWQGQTFIYCTKAKPFLIKGARRYFALSENQIDGFTPPSLNGLLVAKCECRKAIKLLPRIIVLGNDPYVFATKSGRFPNFLNKGILAQSCLSEFQISNYGKGRVLYAYHLENVEPCQFNLSDFYEDEECTKPLKKAPQSYRFAYRQKEIHGEKEGFFNYFPLVKSEKVLIFSDHSTYCASILNGEKDLELRTKLIKGVKAI